MCTLPKGKLVLYELPMQCFHVLSASGVSLDPVYKSLNRTILFQLSRPVDSVSGQTQILDSLHKLTSNRSLVFGPGNYDQEFLGALCYCLLNLTDDTLNR